MKNPIPDFLCSLADNLFIVFLVFKLTGYVTWSWWWVTAPLWAPLGCLLVVAAVLWFLCLIED